GRNNTIEQRRDADVPYRRARRARRTRAGRDRPHRETVQRSSAHAQSADSAQAGPGMISENLLTIVMLIEIGLLVLAVGLFFLHGVWLFFDDKRLRRLTMVARESLARLVTRGFVNVEEIQALRELPNDVQVVAFLEISQTLTGTGNESLRCAAQ